MKKESVTIVIGMVVIVGILYFLGIKGRHSLQKNTAFTHAIIKDIKYRYKDAGIDFSYTFMCNGKELENSTLFSCDYSKINVLRKFFINTKFPMIFDSVHCFNNFILLDNKKIEQYHLQDQLSDIDKNVIRLLDSIKTN